VRGRLSAGNSTSAVGPGARDKVAAAVPEHDQAGFLLSATLVQLLHLQMLSGSFSGVWPSQISPVAHKGRCVRVPLDAHPPLMPGRRLWRLRRVRRVGPEETGLAVPLCLGFMVFPAAGLDVVITCLAVVCHRIDVVVLEAEAAPAVRALGSCESRHGP